MLSNSVIFGPALPRCHGAHETEAPEQHSKPAEQEHVQPISATLSHLRHRAAKVSACRLSNYYSLRKAEDSLKVAALAPGSISVVVKKERAQGSRSSLPSRPRKQRTLRLDGEAELNRMGSAVLGDNLPFRSAPYWTATTATSTTTITAPATNNPTARGSLPRSCIHMMKPVASRPRVRPPIITAERDLSD